MKDVTNGMHLVIVAIIITLIISAATSAKAEEKSGYDAATFKAYAKQVKVYDDGVQIGVHVNRNRQHDNERQAAMIANDQRQYQKNAADGQAHTEASQADWTGDLFVINVNDGLYSDKTSK